MYIQGKHDDVKHASQGLAAGLEGSGELIISGGQSSICPEFISRRAFLGFFILITAVSRALSLSPSLLCHFPFIFFLLPHPFCHHHQWCVWPLCGDHPGFQLSLPHKSPPVSNTLVAGAGNPSAGGFWPSRPLGLMELWCSTWWIRPKAEGFCCACRIPAQGLSWC